MMLNKDFFEHNLKLAFVNDKAVEKQSMTIFFNIIMKLYVISD